MPMRPGIHHSDNHGTCCCGEHRSLSKEERIEILEKHRESLKRELERVEEELKKITG